MRGLQELVNGDRRLAAGMKFIVSMDRWGLRRFLLVRHRHVVGCNGFSACVWKCGLARRVRVHVPRRPSPAGAG
jgi:hypothetical protein